MFFEFIARVWATLVKRPNDIEVGFISFFNRRKLAVLVLASFVFSLAMVMGGVVAKAQDDEEIKVRSIMVTANRVLQELFTLPMTV
ncbi:MAG: hypothetical protein LBT38_06495, partial [Deltaproteobacteria bacterium]|nr:hypothetical protein [Deltaproteobacteria bacterium]